MVGKGASRVPERWTDYIPLGRRLPGTRFIAFKVPLKKSFDQKLHPEERFSPQDLIKKIREQKEELGLIIDLTYTTRYYRPEELPATLCYSKILTMGHEIPNRETIFQFKRVVKKFLRDNKDNDKLIGVHCTHGLNRTGYLVCRYLIDVEGMEPNTAIELFNRARGHPIERTNYIQDLRKRSVKKNCGPTNMSLDPFSDRYGATPNTKMHMAKLHPHRLDHFPLAMPRNPGSAAKNRRRGAQPQARHWELAHEQEVAEPRWPYGWAAMNSPFAFPVNEGRSGLYFPHPGPNFFPPQEIQAAGKHRRWRRRPCDGVGNVVRDGSSSRAASSPWRSSRMGLAA
ncbi:RNA/RNP complex-1-interacting phosphatase [Podargus strigoides]